VVVIAGGGGGDGGGGSEETGGIADVAIPDQQETNMRRAARAAGCTVRTVASEGAGHTEDQTTPVEYESNPPTSGRHHPVPAEDGIYAPGKTPPKDDLVHSFEQGRNVLQYRKSTPERNIGQLQTLVAESDGYKQLLVENNTEMPYAFAATAWTQMLSCEAFNDRMFDAIRAFRERYTDKGPEFVP